MSPAGKCAHMSCKCAVPAGRPFGDFCSDYCLDAAHRDPVQCECGHADCPRAVAEVVPPDVPLTAESR